MTSLFDGVPLLGDGFIPVGARGAAVVVFTLPLHTRNPLNAAWGNSRRAGFARANEKRNEEKTTRLYARAALRAAGLTGAELVPCVVVMTRLSSGEMDDDGLAGALKKVRDGIALALCIDDGSRFIRFRPRQRKAKPGTQGVEVAIFRADVCAMWGDDPR
jgi:hypothetical protein